ncbi:organomercurial lyase MerB [Actinomadura rudentiformis]|uniref:Alkylmercury lyase n=1 Tax=Actinomadura rudentiformis TaxID=359158 RepID=A0A6H9YDP3_9ACTN|nr:organomercurial lyase MerB [Actinomadura rudentiformis]KAB2343737.1 organomercurial lyase MerB [Actinomadura rudentiformis]
MTSQPGPEPSLEGVFRAETGSTLNWLGLPLLRLLARGRPVTADQLAAVTGRPIEQVRAALAGQGDIEYDDQRQIIGNGITLRPTAHRFIVDGASLFTWCALDTLVFPALLGRPADVESTCHATGVPVHLHVEPDRVTAVEPATTVVSLVTPADRTEIRSSFCNQVHFFASAHAAAAWLHDHPGASVLPTAQAQHQARSLIQSLPLAGGPGECSCC